MKKFTFQLSRVMDWRRAQAQAEEIKLERLHAELRAIDIRDANLKQERAESERALLAAPGATGFDLAALDAFQRYTQDARARIAQARSDCNRKIAAQLQVVNLKRRDVRLLERLRERRLKVWLAEVGRETERQADEAYLARTSWVEDWQPRSRYRPPRAEEPVEREIERLMQRYRTDLNDSDPTKMSAFDLCAWCLSRHGESYEEAAAAAQKAARNLLLAIDGLPEDPTDEDIERAVSALENQ